MSKSLNAVNKLELAKRLNQMIDETFGDDGMPHETAAVLLLAFYARTEPPERELLLNSGLN